MNKEKTIDAKLISFAAVAAILGAGFATAVGVSAYGGMMGPQSDMTDRQGVMSAIEDGDYESWVNLTEGKRGRMAPNTEDAFNTMVERHKSAEDAIKSGDYDAWAKLMDGHGRISTVVDEDNFDTFVEMHEAMESGDFEKAQELRTELGLGIHPQDDMGYRKGGHRGNGMSGGMNNGGSQNMLGERGGFYR